MKVRAGFVSNSSSTAFILDLRTPGVAELVAQAKCEGVRRPQSLDRWTALAVGKEAMRYSRDWTEDWGYIYYGLHQHLGHFIKGWALKIGEENVVFMRESDEGMGGYLPFRLDIVRKLALAEMEYH